MKEMRTYMVAKSSLPLDWKEISPLEVDQYLWLHNGYCPKVEARLYYTSERLHIRFEVFESEATARYHSPGDPVYKDSCVEFFVQPVPASDARYLNFELNAAGALLLELGEERGKRIPLSKDSYELFQIQGHLNTPASEAGDKEPSWQLELSIPFDWLHVLFPDFTVQSGQILRANFYKCGDETPLPHYGCWNRVDSELPDFHLSSCFGELKFQ